jgi:hypothetical protein
MENIDAGEQDIIPNEIPDILDNLNLPNSENNQNSNQIPRVINISPLTSTIEEIHRATNQEILNVFQRLVILRERVNYHSRLRSEILDIEENLYEFITSNKVFIFSPFLILLLISFLGLQISAIFENNLIPQLSLKSLEKPILWLPYIFFFLIFLVLIWNVYLLIFKIVTCLFDKSSLKVKKKNLFECGTADILYFNPLYFNMLIIHYDKAYMATNFDLFVIMLISTHYFINFLFSNFIYNFYKLKITNITNLHLKENKILIYKFRCLFFFLISMNIMTSYLMSYLTTEADFYFIYLMQHKSVYLLLKQLYMIYENETEYKQLDNCYSTNEQYYLQSIFIKMVLQMIIMILIVQILFFGNGLFCKKGSYIFFIPCSIVCVKTIYDFLKIFRNYEDIKMFFDRLENV